MTIQIEAVVSDQKIRVSIETDDASVAQTLKLQVVNALCNQSSALTMLNVTQA